MLGARDAPPIISVDKIRAPIQIASTVRALGKGLQNPPQGGLAVFCATSYEEKAGHIARDDCASLKIPAKQLTWVQYMGAIILVPTPSLGHEKQAETYGISIYKMYSQRVVPQIADFGEDVKHRVTNPNVLEISQAMDRLVLNYIHLHSASSLARRLHYLDHLAIYCTMRLPVFLGVAMVTCRSSLKWQIWQLGQLETPAYVNLHVPAPQQCLAHFNRWIHVTYLGPHILISAFSQMAQRL
ncbi:hypothetical protein F5J12DRAFT_785380 [Pisolithus orientalis]|uniref:uncharacterized protein n=1 Tax=Pisolithus orientalis TaxID=936130 RepID=UPI0022250934|nr:uncharacterized protein F5J12DRAFT_785380 [Pisolithus orientalis]KAI5996595.1 hypothetical protein F5J12DRAFT_785380 [Pisolithus orientalis]